MRRVLTVLAIAVAMVTFSGGAAFAEEPAQCEHPSGNGQMVNHGTTIMWEGHLMLCNNGTWIG